MPLTYRGQKDSLIKEFVQLGYIEIEFSCKS